MYRFQWLELGTAFQVFAVAGAVLIIAIVASKGLGTRRKGPGGETASDSARALARASHRLRDAVQNCRRPLITPDEFPDAYNRAEVHSPADQADAHAHLFSRRWAPVIAAVGELDAATHEAEALWGSAIRWRTDVLRKLVRRLQIAADAFIDDQREGGSHFASDTKFGADTYSTLFARPDDPENGFSMELNTAIDQIEDYLKPHLRRE